MGNPIDDAIAEGLLERFKDPDGQERIRPTPEGARQIGDPKLAAALEECKAGRHVFEWIAEPVLQRRTCMCGERRRP